MKPGPLISTAEQTSSRTAAATTCSATERGFDPPSSLASAQRAVGLEVGAVGRPQDRVRTRPDGVERDLQPFEKDAGGVGHPAFSHAPTRG